MYVRHRFDLYQERLKDAHVEYLVDLVYMIDVRYGQFPFGLMDDLKVAFTPIGPSDAYFYNKLRKCLGFESNSRLRKIVARWSCIAVEEYPLVVGGRLFREKPISQETLK
jgi:hypothetical protein